MGNYSAEIRGKDVTISDRPEKQRSCQNMDYSSANKTDAIFKLALLFYIPPRIQFLPCTGHYGHPSLFPESARARLASFL